MTRSIHATLFDDPGCPWGYSSVQYITALQWRYGSQIEWRLVTIGLAEDGSRYEQMGYGPEKMSQGWIGFRRFGMPFAPAPKSHAMGTARGCRAIVAARLAYPGTDADFRVLRALRLANFTSDFELDDDEQIAGVLANLDGIDADAVVATLDSPDVTAAYEADKAETRTAAGSPAEFQGKTANSDGKVRYTAPSVTFAKDGTVLEAGGFQPLAAYDVLIANLDQSLTRRGVPDSLEDALRAFPDGLTTQELALIQTAGNDSVDRDATERSLIALIASGKVARVPLGDQALWQLAAVPARA